MDVPNDESVIPAIRTLLKERGSPSDCAYRSEINDTEEALSSSTLTSAVAPLSDEMTPLQVMSSELDSSSMAALDTAWDVPDSGALLCAGTELFDPESLDPRYSKCSRV